MRIWLLTRFSLAVLLCSLVSWGNAEAAWSKRPFNYTALDQDLRQLLVDFAASEGIGIVISNNVSGTISGTFVNMQPEAFIREISATYGLLWYLFGGVLYVYDTSESETRIVNLTNTPTEQVRQALADLGIYDPRFDWRADEELGMVLFTGPPRYVDLVEEVVRVVEEEMASVPRVAVFRLKYASAGDRTISYRDQTITVPGVTTILQEISGVYGNNQSSSIVRSSGSAAQVRLQSLTGVSGSGSAQIQQPQQAATATSSQSAPASITNQNAAQATGGVRTTGNLTDDDTVRIESDTRLNAVIVKAASDRIPFFRQLIEELDQPSQLVQIDVTILDLATSRLSEVGIEWQLFDDVGVVSSLVSGINPITTGLQIAGSTSANPFDLVADIRLLEQEGDARIVSQPSVITFDGVEAVIDESESVFVRVEGNEDTSLYEVQTGTLLRVTPRMVNFGGADTVELFVEIRDGELDFNQEVDDIPTVDESTITTTAVIENGQGLLLGGLYRTTSIDSEEKVPVLGDIPLIGLAFRSKSVQDTSVARLFLLTPSVVALDRTAERIDLTDRDKDARVLHNQQNDNPLAFDPDDANSGKISSDVSNLDATPTAVAPVPGAPANVPQPGAPRRLIPLPRLSAEPNSLVQLSAAACEVVDYAILPSVLSFERASDWVRCAQQRGGRAFTKVNKGKAANVPGLY